MKRRFPFFVLLLIGCCSGGCSGGGARNPSQESRRPQVVADPAFFEQYAATHRFSLGRPSEVSVTPEGDAVLFLRSGPRSFVQDLYEFDTAKAEERVLLTADQILQGAEEELSVEERARRERMRMSARGIASYSLSKDGTKLLVPLSGRLFVVTRANGNVIELVSDAGFPIDPKFSPDGNYVSCVRDGEIYVTDLATRTERQLTHGAGGTITNGLSEFVAQEEMGRFAGYWWSPGSDMIAYQETDTAGLETMHIMDAMYPDRAPRSWPYPRPGKANAKVRLGVVPVGGGETTWIPWDTVKYSYLATVKWQENAPLTILVQNRRQTEELLFSVDVATGHSERLLSEHDDAWTNLDQAMPHWFRDGSAFLWTTEREGAWTLEHYDRYGKLIAPVTTPDFALKGFVGFDDVARVAYLAGGDDPVQTHIYSVPVDGAPHTPLRLTTEHGLHSFSFSRNYSVYVHSASAVDGKRIQIVRRKDGSAIGRLTSVAEEPPLVPSTEFTMVGRSPAFHAVLVRPRNFDPALRYPVIVSVYGGPLGQTVRAAPGDYLLQQWIADHGFIVVSLDGRGTPSRGRKWERAIKGDLSEVPLGDQVAGLEALGARYSELDLNRVGIYGWSFGGYLSAMAVMRRPDVYHVGVAGAPVADWLDYDTHYTERYMGLPGENPEGYEAASVLTYCKDLRRPLLIIHGTADDNVYFAHALKMSNGLFRAGKEHDLLALSGFTHMVTEPLVTLRLYSRIVEYFRQHLLDG